jgi:hypothetical protein
LRVGDPVIKNGGLEIQLSRMEGWRSSYQEWRVRDPVIKNGGLEIQLSRMEGWKSSYQEWRVRDPVIKNGGLDAFNLFGHLDIDDTVQVFCPKQ